MNLRRKILLGLLIVPALTILASILFPGAGAELAFLVLGVPILVLNAWEFISAGESESILKTSTQPLTAETQEGALMKSKWLLALIVLSSVFILLVIGYTTARSIVDDVPYSTALYAFLIKLGTKLWHFLSTPTIFISLLLFVLLVVLASQIAPIIQKLKGIEVAAKFPEEFSRPVTMPVTEESVLAGKSKAKKTAEAENAPAAGTWIKNGLDLKAVQVMLEIDGIELTKSYLVSKLEALNVRAEGIPLKATQTQREAYYNGIVEGWYGSLLPVFCSIETSNADKAARFTLKAGMRDRLMARLNQGRVAAEQTAV
jgi:hypothetical protein